MSTEVPLRIPASHRLEHQDTILISDETDHPTDNVQEEVMATSPPHPTHMHSAIENRDVIVMQSSCTSVSTGPPLITGPLNDTSNSQTTASSRYQQVPNPARMSPPAASTKHNNSVSAAKLSPGEKVAYGELVVLGLVLEPKHV